VLCAVELRRPLPPAEVRFYLDVSSVVRTEWLGRSPWRSQLKFIDEVVEELRTRVNRVLPGVETVIRGCYDRSLETDFNPERNTQPSATMSDFHRMMNRFGFVATPNYDTEADLIILEDAERSSAIVISRDRYGEHTRFHGWLYQRGRLIQQTRLQGGSGWIFSEYPPTGRVLEEVLADLHPVFESYAYAMGAKQEDLERAVLFCRAGGYEAEIGAQVDGVHLRRIQECIRDSLTYRHRLNDLIDADGLGLTDAVHLLALNHVFCVKIGQDLYTSDAGRALILATEPRRLGADLLLNACLERSLPKLGTAVGRLSRMDVDGLLSVATELLESLKTEARIRWRQLECGDGPLRNLPLRWVVDSLREMRDVRRLSTVRISDLPKLDSSARIDVLIARHLPRVVGEWPTKLLHELCRVPSLRDDHPPELLGVLNSRLTEIVEGEGSLLGPIDSEDFSMFAERFAPGTILEDFSLLVRGSVAPISRAVNDRRSADLRRLTRVFFHHVLNLPWIPADVAIRVVKDEGMLADLAEGKVEVLANSPELLELPQLEGHAGWLPDLLRTSRLIGRLSAITADLRRAELLAAEVGSFVN